MEHHDDGNVRPSHNARNDLDRTNQMQTKSPELSQSTASASHSAGISQEVNATTRGIIGDEFDAANSLATSMSSDNTSLGVTQLPKSENKNKKATCDTVNVQLDNVVHANANLIGIDVIVDHGAVLCRTPMCAP